MDSPAKKSRRRTQSERSETTQRKILESALKLVRKEGFEKATLQAIASGAKVTLGAVQHHFESRQQLMERLVDEVMAPLIDRGAVWPDKALPLRERAEAFVSRAWETTYGAVNYLAAWGLFFGCKSTPTLFKRIDAKRATEDPQFFARFLEYFPEVAEHHPQPKDFAALVFAALRGIGVFELFKVDPAEQQGALQALAETIARAGTPPADSKTASGRRGVGRARAARAAGTTD